MADRELTPAVGWRYRQWVPMEWEARKMVKHGAWVRIAVLMATWTGLFASEWAKAGDPAAADAYPQPSQGAATVQTQGLAKSRDSLSAQTCLTCHDNTDRLWRQSIHSVSWVDPEFQELWRHLNRPEACRSCHLPLESARPRLADGAANPNFQPLLPEEGVTCAACHLRDKQVLAARKPSKSALAAHPIRQEPALKTSKFCAQCHQSNEPGKAIYDTYREWEASSFGQRGVTCQSCHTDPRPGVTPDGKLVAESNHKMLGAHSDPQLLRAFLLDVRLSQPDYQDGDTVDATVTLVNHGAGHRVPTGSPLHRIRLTVGVSDGNGQFLSREERWLGRTVLSFVPFSEGEDTRLAPGGDLVVRFKALLNCPNGEERFLTTQLSYFLLPSDLATELGIPEEMISRTFSSRIIPLNP